MALAYQSLLLSLSLLILYYFPSANNNMAEGVKGKVVEQQSVVGVKSEDPDISTAHDVPRSVINGESSIIFSKMICFIVFYCYSLL